MEGTLQKTEFWGILDEQKSVALAKIKIYRILHATIIRRLKKGGPFPSKGIYPLETKMTADLSRKSV